MSLASTLPLVLLSVTSITAHFGVPFLPGFHMMGPMGFGRMRRPCKMGMMGMPFVPPMAFGGAMGSPLGAPFAGGMMGGMMAGLGRGSLAMAGGMGGVAPGMLASPGVAGTTIINSDDSGFQLAGGQVINTDNSGIIVPNRVVGGQFINSDNAGLVVPNGGVVGGNRVVYLGDAPDQDVTVIG